MFIYTHDVLYTYAYAYTHTHNIYIRCIYIYIYDGSISLMNTHSQQFVTTPGAGSSAEKSQVHRWPRSCLGPWVIPGCRTGPVFLMRGPCHENRELRNLRTHGTYRFFVPSLICLCSRQSNQHQWHFVEMQLWFVVPHFPFEPFWA